ncbi:MAG: hypothetical protein FWG34_13570 [Oscillospiraceae bacterium]|nr:hypothetical protein [Oscillospiraceae bacterium]
MHKEEKIVFVEYFPGMKQYFGYGSHANTTFYGLHNMNKDISNCAVAEGGEKSLRKFHKKGIEKKHK